MIKTVSFEIEVTGEVTDQEIQSYLEMTLGCGGYSQDNPLLNEDSEAEISCYDVNVR